MSQTRSNRQSVQLFDVDVFRNKLENYMRKQAAEMCEVSNSRKRKLNHRWTGLEKESLELDENYRDDSVYRFGKRQRSDDYCLPDDAKPRVMPGSSILFPTPIPTSDIELSTSQPWPYLRGFSCNRVSNSQHQSPFASPSLSQFHDEDDCDEDSVEENNDDDDDDEEAAREAEAAEQALAMRRHLSGYSEVDTVSHTYTDDGSSMSPCPPLSRSSLSYRSDMSSCPDTPLAGIACEEAFVTDMSPVTPLHVSAFEGSQELLDLDIDSMAPHERSLLAALAPERFAQAALIKKAFRQSEKLLQILHQESQKRLQDESNDDVAMDDGQYDQVFDELMHV